MGECLPGSGAMLCGVLCAGDEFRAMLSKYVTIPEENLVAAAEEKSPAAALAFSRVEDEQL